MNRRAFLTGLAGVAGAAAAVSLLPSQAHAIPLARTTGETLAETPAERAGDASQARTPDGTAVEQAQYWRHRRRRWRRRRSRLVCRNYRVRGRWVRRCRRVWW